jgi:hypothetical protein
VLILQIRKNGAFRARPRHRTLPPSSKCIRGRASARSPRVELTNIVIGRDCPFRHEWPRLTRAKDDGTVQTELGPYACRFGGQMPATIGDMMGRAHTTGQLMSTPCTADELSDQTWLSAYR